jgi:hypothetical protein
VAQGKTVAEGSIEPVTIVAFNLGMCGSQPAYQTLEWFFPNHGGRFDPGLDANDCTANGQRTDKETETAELAARCFLGAYLRNDLTKASTCVGSLSTAANLFASLGGYGRTGLAGYAVDFIGCVPAPRYQYAGQVFPAGTRLNCRFGGGPNDNPVGVWIVVTAAGPPFHVVDIGPS